MVIGIEGQVTGTDHFRTILDLAGVPVGDATPQDSVSYVSALAGKDYQRPPMFWHSSLGRPAQTGDTRSSAVVEGDWKLIGKEQKGFFLGSLTDQIPERKNYIKEKPEITERLTKLYKEWLEEVMPKKNL